MIYFAVSIFLSAFLLFQVEPMIAKYILPWFGGSTAVWSTVILFFQILLTGGYAYAAWLTSKAHRREKVHLFLLGFSLVLLSIFSFLWKSPITPSNAWKPPEGAFPVWQIFKLLFISVGLPYFLLSSNSPLIQAWFSNTFPEKTAYRLYSLSNIGSLLALITYPILIEPNLTLAWQGRIWSLAYTTYAGLAAYGAIRAIRSNPAPITEAAQAAPDTGSKPRIINYVLWIGLAGTASALLLAVTSQVTQEVASIPFLWVLPLTVYLLTFVLAFSSERWYPRQVFVLVFFGVSLLALWALSRSAALGIWPQIGIYSLLLFTACMVCHGELYRMRPHPARLTTFYLMVSIGGAIGGAVINFVAPYVFKGFWELPLGLTFCWLIFLAVTIITRDSKSRRWLFVVNSVLLLSMTILTSVRSYQQIHSDLNTGLFIDRNFYGVVRVRVYRFTAAVPIHLGSINQTITSYNKYSLVHGVTVHGYQFHDETLRYLPTSYYGNNGGGGLAILNSPNRGKGMRVGVLGLGIGTLAAYGQPGDTYRFYEINPLVIDMARGEKRYFSYLSDSQANIEVVLGDARLSLENELEAGERDDYDVLVLDVFSSDSIPVHLLDEEAFAIYLQRLRPEGMLALHISNTHLNLVPVVWKLADHFGLARAVIDDNGDGVITQQSRWVLLAKDPALLESPPIAEKAKPMDGYTTSIRLWTDDYNNLFQILH
jgi:hypothetical protein